MKILCLVASDRMRHTWDAAQSFLQELKKSADVQTEIIRLADFKIEPCKGCIICFDKGEQHCPHDDDRDAILEKLEQADGLILAVPNYAFQIPGTLKILLDRMGYIFHRPRFFGRWFSAIVVQGVYGGKDIEKYLNFIGRGLGFNTVTGSIITTREPISEKRAQKNKEALTKHATRYAKALTKKNLPNPGIMELMMFRMSRSGIKESLDSSYRDYSYFEEQGWMSSDFYYPVRLGLFKRLMGRIFDQIKMPG